MGTKEKRERAGEAYDNDALMPEQVIWTTSDGKLLSIVG